MSGLLRNLLTLVLGALRHKRITAGGVVVTEFRVTPFDTGIKVLKSDKYLQFAETAQLDYLLKTATFLPLLRSGVAFVNVAQSIRFSRAVPLFSLVQVETQLLYADERCGYFLHEMRSDAGLAAEVLVKMKFKKGRLTIPPSTFFDFHFAEIPSKVRVWSGALDAM